MRIGRDVDAMISAQEARELADGIVSAQSAGRLRAEHRFHLRCEVSDGEVVPGYELFEDLAGVDVVSLMDHTPGQRQFASIDAYRMYFQGRDGLSDEAFARFRDERLRNAERWSDRNRQELASRARTRGVVIASHDDATVAHVAEAVRDGVTLAEFPTTVAAAEASRAAGMRVMMGGPNLVRGGSHAGNVSAGDLAERGALDIVSSDYVPFSMLQAAFLLAERAGWSLPAAIALVSAEPAAAIGLTDRGVLTVGHKADLVRVHRTGAGETPVVRCVWRDGVRVA